MQKTYRIVKSKIKNDLLIVSIPDFGIDLHYKLLHSTSVDPITKYDDDVPDFTTEVNIDFIKIVKHKNSKTQQEIANLLKDTSIIPPNLVYDHVLVGFVYADVSDPNNFRWWLDFRDSKNQSIYNYYGDNIEINCPITTKSWHDEDPNGIWHGRFVLSSNELSYIKEPSTGKLIINGKPKTEKLDYSKVCSPTQLPKKGKKLRLRYNIREDIWFCDVLDKNNKELETIPCKSIICDAKMYGDVIPGNKPKVSTIVNISDISNIAIAVNSLIIRGK